MTRTVTIDHNNPEQVAAFNAVWRLSDAERAAIQDRANAQRELEAIVRERGVLAAISWQMDRWNAAERPAALLDMGRAAA
jgi:hypothetical protein